LLIADQAVDLRDDSVHLALGGYNRQQAEPINLNEEIVPILVQVEEPVPQRRKLKGVDGPIAVWKRHGSCAPIVSPARCLTVDVVSGRGKSSGDWWSLS
jgi:hypothetical protein